MMKVGLTYKRIRGTAWDHHGKSEISQIFISLSQDRIHSICFAYVEDGENVVLSSKIGGVEGSFYTLKTITLDYPSEYITGISGCIYDDVDEAEYRFYDDLNFALLGHYLGSITFHTNKTKYGPYTPQDFRSYTCMTNFNYQVADNFDGFYGTYMPDGIESIGFYIKPLQISSQQNASPYLNVKPLQILSQQNGSRYLKVHMPPQILYEQIGQIFSKFGGSSSSSSS